jgi:ATP-dependent helicase HrpB
LSAPKPLPIDEILPQLSRALARHDCVVLEAPPGAGKTTRVPLALIDEPWCAGGMIVMLEPRRLAARMAARYMAGTLGERAGATVGYSVRMERRVSAATRVEVVTEGLLLRRMQDDPSLEGVKLVILDEFHERSLDGDLALALALDIREGLRPDLKILVMSATLDGVAVAALMGDAPVLRSAGRSFPVETRYLDKPPAGRFEEDMTALLAGVLTETSGSVLAFLPGEAEIERVARAIAAEARSANTSVCPLYGALPRRQQDDAVRAPGPGRRKLVLATTIAETSITIEGISVVVDGGLKRRPRFDPRRGFGRLVTVKVSRAAAAQRRGRAGRVAAGTCYRLWTQAQQRGLDAFDTPEMMDADLTDLALALAEWGVDDAADLAWCDPPPAGPLAQARAMLRRLDALDADGRITPTGRAIVKLPLPARLGRMVVRGHAEGQGLLAVELAALLTERDFLARGEGVDVVQRLQMLHRSPGDLPGTVRTDALQRVRTVVHDLARRLGEDSAGADGTVSAAARLLALAYPDRLAAETGAGRYRLAGGGSAFLPPDDPLHAAEFIVAVDVGGNIAAGGQVRMAAALQRAELEELFAPEIVEEQLVEWDHRRKQVGAVVRRCLGEIVVSQERLDKPDGDAVTAAMLTGIRKLGIDALPWTDELRRLRSRVEFARTGGSGEEFPDLTDDALLASLEDWLAAFLGGIDNAAKLVSLDLTSALKTAIGWSALNKLDDLAPEHFLTPLGSRIAIDYGADGGPLASVRLQEMFGVDETPLLAGRTPLRFQLLSPAGRPLALTADLSQFWRSGYQLVRKDMRGRYPKHDWPEEPMTALPSKGAKRRRR